MKCLFVAMLYRRITNAPVADIFLIWARSSLHNDAICCFLLEKGMTGISTCDMEEKYCLRSVTNGYIRMQDVEVPEYNLLPKSIGLQVLSLRLQIFRQ